MPLKISFSKSYKNSISVLFNNGFSTVGIITFKLLKKGRICIGLSLASSKIHAISSFFSSIVNLDEFITRSFKHS